MLSFSSLSPRTRSHFPRSPCTWPSEPGSLGPAPAAYVAAIAPPNRRGAAMGLFRSVSEAGFVLGPPLIGFMIDEWGFSVALAMNGLILLLPAAVFAMLVGSARVGTLRSLH
ncbi:MAG TPA: MFS transporter [Dehalococcoidia bacterium]|nr:MFS transporter [Dehalococcoidia bacterium]